MHKKAFILLIFLLVLFYATAFLNLLFVFIISLVALSYIGPLLFTSIVIWPILPESKRNTFVSRRVYYYIFVAVLLTISLLAYGIARNVINHYFANTSAIPRMSVKIMVFAFIFLSVLNLLSKGFSKTNSICIAVYILFVTIGLSGVMLSPAVQNDGHEKPGQSLTSLPYLAWAPLGEDGDKKGVTVYKPTLSNKGLNYYTSLSEPYVFLIDMEGNILHKWTLDTVRNHDWLVSKVLKNGDVLSITNQLENQKELLKRIDWNSNIIWEIKIRSHHEVTVAENGDIYLLASRNKIVFLKGFPFPILDDYIYIVSAGGEILREIPIFRTIRGYISFRDVIRIYKWLVNPKNILNVLHKKVVGKHLFYGSSIFDIIHDNRISIVPEQYPAECPVCEIWIIIP